MPKHTIEADWFQHSINWMADEAHGLAVKKGWWDQDRNILELICLIHSELGEATEAARMPGESKKIPGFSMLEEELADTIIRILDASVQLRLDIAGAVLAKHEYNHSRPERHGGKLY